MSEQPPLGTRRLRASRLGGVQLLIRVLLGCVAAALLVALIWLVPPLLYRSSGAGLDARLSATANTRAAFLAAAAGLVALWSVYVNTRNLRLGQHTLEVNQEANRLTLEATRDGQIAERYTKAIEQLGSEKLPISMGGIYALERLADDSARDHSTVIEVLSAFVRERSRAAPMIESVSADVEAAVVVLGRLNQPSRHRIDLSESFLKDARLEEVNLAGANMREVDLTHARLAGANFTRAWLHKALLAGAWVHRTNFTEAHLGAADLTGVRGLRQAQIDVATGDGDTRLPPGVAFLQTHLIPPKPID